ncbi:hypothetical protein N7540_010976 [Penicillium herquei]|nr:hypothetical protein N7540_010976 [Penicillium herquei]
MFEQDGLLESSQHLETFALSSLLIGSAFAFPRAIARSSQAESSSLSELIEIFMLIRKMMNFSTPTIDAVKQSELRDLFLVEEIRSNVSESSRIAIAALHELQNASCSQVNEHYHTFTSTIDCLEKLLGQLDSEGEMISRSFAWVCEVPAEYISLLQKHDPLALVILAHYCVVLYRLRQRWWISSWGELVIQSILKFLSPAWKLSMAWALQETNVSCL